MINIGDTVFVKRVTRRNKGEWREGIVHHLKKPRSYDDEYVTTIKFSENSYLHLIDDAPDYYGADAWRQLHKTAIYLVTKERQKHEKHLQRNQPI
jgi:hypothetical protein